MALIKKYNAGGKAGFRDFVVEKLFTEKGIDTKAQELINQELATFDPSGIVEGEISPFSGTINDTNTANSWLKSNYKEFTEKPLTRELKPSEGVGREREVGSILDYITRSDFGNNEDHAIRTIGEMTDNNKIKQYAIQKAKKLTTEYLTQAAQESISAPENKWHKKEELQAIQNVLSGIDENAVISDQDWNKVVDFTNKLDWQLDSFLRTSDELRAIKEEKEAKDKEAFFNTNLDKIKGLGLKEEDAISLANQGYTLNNEYEPFEDMPFLSKAMKDNGYNFLLGADKQNNYIIKDGKIVTDASGIVADDQLSKYHGYSWGVDSNGHFTMYSPDRINENKELKIPESSFKNNVGRQIITDDGEFEGYEIYGYSGDDLMGNYDKDAYKNRDFTKEFIFKKDGKEFKVIRGDDGIYRKEGEDRKFNMPKNMKFGENTSAEIVNYMTTFVNNPASILHSVKKPHSPKLSVRDLGKKIDAFELAHETATKADKPVHIKKSDVKMVAEQLRYFIEIGGKLSEDAARLTARLTKLGERKMADGTLFGDSETFNFKLGGVLKAQQGASLTSSFAESARKTNRGREAYENYTAPESAKRGAQGVYDPTGTVADSNALDWISTGASVASFIPLVGMAGGLVSTGADALNAYNRGWTKGDTWNLLTNIGFTALSGIGLGALKGVKLGAKAGKIGKLVNTTAKAAKAGKVVDKADDVGDVARLLTKAGKAAQRGKNLGGLGSEVATSASKVSKFAEALSPGQFSGFLKGTEGAVSQGTLIRAAKKAGYNIEDLSKLKSLIKTDISTINQLSSVKLGLAGRAGDSIVKGAKQIAGMTPELEGLAKAGRNTVKYGFGAVQAYGGITGAANVVGNVREYGLSEGLGRTQMRDIRNIAQTAAIGSGYYKNRLNKKAIQNSTETRYVKGSEPSETLSFKDEDGNVLASFNTTNKPGQQSKIAKFKSLFSKGGEKIGKSGMDQKTLDAYESSLKGIVDDKDIAPIMERIKAGGVPQYNKSAGEIAGVFLKDSPDDLNPATVREYLRAQKLMKRGTANHFGRANYDPDRITTVAEYNASNVRAPITDKRYLIGQGNPIVTPAKAVSTQAPIVSTQAAAVSPKVTTPITATIRKYTGQGNIPMSPNQRPYSIRMPSVTRDMTGQRLPNYRAPIVNLGGNNASITKIMNQVKTPKFKVTVNPNAPKISNLKGQAKFQNTIATRRRNNMRVVRPDAQTSLDFKDGGVLRFNTGGMFGTYSASSKYHPLYNPRPRLGGTQSNTLASGNKYNPEAVSRESLYNSTKPDNSNVFGLHTGKVKPKYTYDPNFKAQETAPLKDESVHIDELAHIPWQQKDYVNNNSLYEGIRLGTSNRANAESTALRQRAATSFATKTGLSKEHFRTSTPFSSIAEKQAGTLRSAGRRIGNTVSDIDKSLATQLTAEKQASDTIMEGRFRDIQQNEATKNRGQEFNAGINQYNAGISDFNKATAANAEAKIFGLSAEEKQMRGTNNSAFVLALGKEAQEAPYRRALHDYGQKLSDPNLSARQRHIAELTSETAMEKLRTQHKNYTDNATSDFEKQVSFEDWSGYKDYMADVERQSKPLQGMIAHIGNLKSIVDSYGLLLGGKKK